jgi:hypothetical protein
LPRIAEFYGIAIYMYYRDQIEGRLPQRALALARAWGKLHVEDLERDWELAREHRPLRRIAPLE